MDTVGVAPSGILPPLDESVRGLVVEVSPYVGVLARGKRQPGGLVPDVSRRGAVVLIELLEAACMIPEIAGPYHGIAHDRLLHGEVPVLDSRIGHVLVEIRDSATAASQALGGVRGLD